MRQLIVIQYVSLDGVAQAPGHADEDREGGFDHGGWTGPFMQDHRRYGAPLYRGAGAFLFGRLTYEIWLEHWPQVTDPDDDIAAALNGRPKYVMSTTLSEATWPGTTIIRGGIVDEVIKLKDEPGGDIVVAGSSQLTQTLTEHHLVDRYQLWLHPVILGKGKQLFPHGSPRTDLKLIDSTLTSSGLAILSYEPTARKSDRS